MIFCLITMLNDHKINALDVFIETLAWCCLALTVKILFYGGFC